MSHEKHAANLAYQTEQLRADVARLTAELATAQEWNERYAIDRRELREQKPAGYIYQDHTGAIKLAQTEPPPFGSFPVFYNSRLAAAPQPPADHVPGAGKTIELLREVETRYLADLLSHSIAGLGYPVGCGIPPSDDHAMKAAAALFDRFVTIAAAMQKGAQ